MMKKLLAIFLCLFLTVSLFAVSASAEGTEEGTAVCEATLKGYQNQNGGYGVRIIAEVSNIDAYSEVGFVLSDGTNKEVTRAATCVFQTLIAEDGNRNQYEALTAEDGKYLYALTITGINAEDALTLTVAPYTTSKEGVTVRGTEKTLTKPADDIFAVRHTVTYLCEDETVGTVSVVHGESAALPTPPTGYYWSMANVGDVCNVTSDKTVTLTKVATSGYQSTRITFTPAGLTDEVKEKYSIVLSHSGSATNDPALQSWGATVLYQAGQTVEWKTDAAGDVSFYGNCDKNGQHITLGFYIDGYLWDTYELTTPQGLTFVAKNVPAGMHTFRLEVLAATTDGDAFASYAGLAFTQIQSNMTATVVYMNGSEVYDVKTVPYGGKASAPTTPVKDGYTFSGWLLDDAEFDFGTAITGDITLTAKWTADTAEYTVTFVDAEGATISTVKVLEGRDIDLDSLPKAGTDKYYAASTEDWKKCFGVTRDETVTLTLCTNTDYPTVSSNGGGLWGASLTTTAVEKLNLTTSWGGAVNDWKNKAGLYFTVSGDISFFKFVVNVNAGANTVLKVYVDDCLVHTETIDNSSGTAGVQPTISVTRFLAGQHTIKVEIAEISGGGLTFVMVDARLRPAATTTDTSSAAQVQAILVDTKENGI